MESLDLSPATNSEKTYLSRYLPIVNAPNTHTIQDSDISLLNQEVDSSNVTSCEQSKKPSLAMNLKMPANHNTEVTPRQPVKRPAAQLRQLQLHLRYHHQNHIIHPAYLQP